MRVDRRLRRSFDQLVDRALVRGSLLAAVILLVGSLMVVIAGAFVVAVGHINIEGQEESVIEVAWQVLLRAMSPDQLMGNDGWDERIVLLIVTVIGLLLVSTLISILNSVIERRMEFIHRGRGTVLLSDHLVILNWNQFGVRVVREIAQSSEPGKSPPRLSILCDEDPVHLMQEIRSSLSNEFRSSTSKLHQHFSRHPEKWITIRRGKATNTSDLVSLTSISTAKSVIILRDQAYEQVQSLRVVLAIDAVLANDTSYVGNLPRLPVVTFTNRHILATQLDNHLIEISRGNHKARRYINYIPLSTEDIRHGVETQVSRHRGLSAVYQDLLNFGGNELYIVEGSRFGGTFGDLLLNATHSIPLFVISASGLNMWPDWDTPLSNSKVVLLAECRYDAERTPQASAICDLSSRNLPDKHEEVAERFLFIGWNEDAERLAISLRTVLPYGSQLTVVRRPLDTTVELSDFCGNAVVTISELDSNPLAQSDFLSNFEHVIVFMDKSVDAGTSDASVLIDILACRHHANQISDPAQRFTIVAELQKRSSRYIAGDRLADDLLINDSLLASAAVQLAFAPELEEVILALLSVDDPVELVTRRISLWNRSLDGSTWDDIISLTARETGEIPIGFRRLVNRQPVVLLNPSRSTVCSGDDEVVLLSHRKSARSN